MKGYRNKGLRQHECTPFQKRSVVYCVSRCSMKSALAQLLLLLLIILLAFCLVLRALEESGTRHLSKTRGLLPAATGQQS